MIRKIAKLTACFAAGLFALTLGVGALTADEKKAEMTISEIMKKGHAGQKSSIAQLKAAVKGEKWDDAVKSATELKVMGEALPLLKPGKGDDASWKKLGAKYKENTAAAATAAAKKDAAGVTKALGGINCKECHDAHK